MEEHPIFLSTSVTVNKDANTDSTLGDGVEVGGFLLGTVHTPPSKPRPCFSCFHQQTPPWGRRTHMQISEELVSAVGDGV